MRRRRRLLASHERIRQQLQGAHDSSTDTENALVIPSGALRCTQDHVRWVEAETPASTSQASLSTAVVSDGDTEDDDDGTRTDDVWVRFLIGRARSALSKPNLPEHVRHHLQTLLATRTDPFRLRLCCLDIESGRIPSIKLDASSRTGLA